MIRSKRNKSIKVEETNSLDLNEGNINQKETNP